jgi:hypothetical protein
MQPQQGQGFRILGLEVKKRVKRKGMELIDLFLPLNP